MKVIRIGTRGSKLALVQTELVSNALRATHVDLQIEVVEIKTLGDRKQGTAAASDSDKKDWVVDLELALLNQSIDLAVHSGKDVPSELEPGTALSSILERANPYDAFIGSAAGVGERIAFADLPPSAKIGTSSLRRQALLKRHNKSLRPVEHRGNVPTRLRKLDESEDLSGILLASAGLDRLGLTDVRYEKLPPTIMLPALNQGTLSVQYRNSDAQVQEFVSPLVDSKTQAAFQAERAVAEILEGDCHSAIGIFAQVEERELELTAKVLSPDGAQMVESTIRGQMEQAPELGITVGKQLLELGARDIIERASAA